MNYLFNFIVFIFGLCCGSFVNMLVYRTAKRYEITNDKFLISNDKRSFCDFCGKQLHWYENVPVVSWIIQKGKSRCCGKSLPREYPIIEVVTGILFVIVWAQCIAPIQILLGFVIITLLVFSTVFDLKYMILPDFSTYILIGISIVLIIMGGNGIPPLQYLLSAVGASLFLLLLNLVTKGKGMGIGDVKLALFMGLFLGWPKTLVAMYVAFIVGAVVGVFLIFQKKLKRKSVIPFGPFLILGTAIAYCFNFKFLISYF